MLLQPDVVTLVNSSWLGIMVEESRWPVMVDGAAAAIIGGRRRGLAGRGGCNTPGVCHQLSNGFKLEHGILSDDENVKVKPMEMSPNLNLDIAPLLYI